MLEEGCGAAAESVAGAAAPDNLFVLPALWPLTEEKWLSSIMFRSKSHSGARRPRSSEMYARRWTGGLAVPSPHCGVRTLHFPAALRKLPRMTT